MKPFIVVYNSGYYIKVYRPSMEIHENPSLSVREFMKQVGWRGKNHSREEAQNMCATLNRMVEDGRIIYHQDFYSIVKS